MRKDAGAEETGWRWLTMPVLGACGWVVLAFVPLRMLGGVHWLWYLPRHRMTAELPAEVRERLWVASVVLRGGAAHAPAKRE